MDVPGDPFADDPAKSLAVESDGALLVRTGQGLQRVLAGEVSVRALPGPVGRRTPSR